MAHHLTPPELALKTGMDPRDVIASCLAGGVPILHGRIDKTLFTATLVEMAAAEGGSEGAGSATNAAG
jgi:hypothetical protein